MKSTIYIVLLLLFPVYVHAQTSDKYKELIKQAEDHYNNKRYKESAQEYIAALNSGERILMISDIYGASCSMAQAGMVDSAFSRLNFLAANGGFANYEHLIGDTDLVLLHSDVRWDALCKRVKENKDKKDREEASQDKSLVAILDTIYKDDQDGRKQIETTTKEFGRNSREMQELSKAIREKDSVNLVRVEKILNEHGWLGADVVGNQGTRTIFLVIQHAGIKTQEKYLPMMREAVKNRKANASNLALLEDRIALRQGKKQIYGSQIATTKDGETYIQPLDDPDNVDKRRADVGLGPLADYVQRWNLKWDPETYKRQLPEIEKKQRETFGDY